MNLLLAGRTIINVDEAWYNRTVKQNYSWLPKGRSERIINDRWQGRAITIFALMSSGDWVALIGNKTTNSDSFIRFLFILKKFTEISLMLEEEPITITLDNASIHLTNKTKWAAEVLKLRLFLLPPYSPMLAPVEWVFGTSKRIISTAKNGGALNFGGIDGKLVIADSMMKIDPPRGKRLWLQFIESMKIVIGEVRLATKIKTTIEEEDEEGENSLSQNASSASCWQVPT